MKACADKKKRKGSRRLPDPERTGRVAREDQEREGHDREAAELRHRAEPDERNAAPSEHGAVIVGAISNQRAQRREQERKRKHARDDPGRHGQFDDHHPVEGSNQQNRRHADRHLKQRQTQQPRHRQLGRRRIRERKHAWPEVQDAVDDRCGGAVHRVASSRACEM